MPAVGLVEAPASGDQDAFNPLDRLIFNTNFSAKAVSCRFGRLAASRAQCRPRLKAAGRIPAACPYGIAVPGLIGRAGGVPVRLVVSRRAEPKLAAAVAANWLQAKVVVSTLRPGRAYILLRYDDHRQLPREGSAAAWLSVRSALRVEFRPTSSDWIYHDPELFPATSSRYYFCVEKPLGPL